MFAHIFHSHYDAIVNVSAQGHLNTLFTHFICFGKEFGLFDKRELEPCSDFISFLEQEGTITNK